MSLSDKVQCRACFRRVDSQNAFVAYRTGGGSYKRAARDYASTICRPCATRLLKSAPATQSSIDHWDALALRRGLAR